jgi:hypothetical protein
LGLELERSLEVRDGDVFLPVLEGERSDEEVRARRPRSFGADLEKLLQVRPRARAGGSVFRPFDGNRSQQEVGVGGDRAWRSRNRSRFV